jgi:3',5'-cyclic AMP phosphodiesterase CpdA
MPAFHEGARIVVVGDLQRTAPLLEFWREQNDAERAQVVAAIAAERPDLVVVTGDCVFDGASDGQWSAFERLTASWRAGGLPVASAFGNHEYWGGRAAAEAHVFPRFPLDAGRHWFVIAFGPLRIVVLDSNAGELGAADWGAEVAWYGATLTAFDADTTVRGVLVAFHHAPFSNSTVTDDDADVQRDLVPPFARAKKTLAMLNGHVHSYERFAKDGKTYVVSGGGGGPRAELQVGDARRHPDDLYDGPAIRELNYATYAIADDGVRAEVHGLARGGSTWRVIDRFGMAWP